MKMVGIVITFLILNGLFTNVCGEKLANGDDDFTDTEHIYSEMNNALKQLVRQGIKGFMSQMVEAGQEMNLSSSCMGNIFQLVTGIRDLQIWALNFPDACGKITDGIMLGNTQAILGNYDQCLAATAKTEDGNIDFQGRYCLLNIQPHLPHLEKFSMRDRLEKMKLITENITDILKFYILKSVWMQDVPEKYGLCVPSGCDQADVEKMAYYVGKKVYLNTNTMYCHVEADTHKMNFSRIFTIAIFTMFGVLCIVGTIVDCYSKESKIKSAATEFLLCFSVAKNFPKLINVETSEKALTCINGIRVLTLFYIILSHEYLAKALFFAQKNVIPNFLMYLPGLFVQIPVNGYLSVDVFFFLGGFLNSYLRMKYKGMNGSLTHVWKILIHRLWRIYPAFIASIFITLLLTPRGPWSPLYEEVYINNCYSEWWKNLLFINNYYSADNVCVEHFWYVAVDMQLFILSLVTVPLLIRRPKIGISVNLAVILAGLILSGLLAYIMKIPPTFIIYNATEVEIYTSVRAYSQMISHVAPYFIGIIMGYALSMKKEWKISKACQIIGWCTAGAMFTSVLFITMKWNAGIPYSIVESAFYFSLSKAAYALAIGWLLFCCMTRNGGVINYILSLKIWIPLARISYMLYLVSSPVQFFYNANKRTTTDSHPSIIIWEYFGTLCVSSLLSLALVILVESPFIAMEKLVFKRKKIEDNTHKDGNSQLAEKSEKENGDIQQQVVHLDVIPNGKV